ncbi:YVTN family beta-propeller repeat protein [Cytobacillus massiliigabonensis]|uniref:YVTN family beta-propeller repeat protein n=1 Tax=Cytobacillus massiliigabonensis TaxID=1871011 RepID=UPI000C8500D3|nr:YncE family protein [Cytobacillus massiliigabonensis]
MKKVKLSFIIILVVLGVILTGCSTGTDKNSEAEANANEVNKSSDENKSSSESDLETFHFYFTANEGGSISKIDAATDKVVDTIDVDGVVHNVQVSPDGKMLGATVIPGGGEGHGEDSHGESDGNDTHGDSHGKSNESSSNNDQSHGGGSMGIALFYDIETNELLNTVEVGSHPAHFVFTEDGKYALVTNSEDNNISVIDMNNFTVTDTIITGKGPHGFRISADSQRAYIANMSEDTVSVVNLELLKEEKRIKVGSTPVTTGITSDGKTLVATLNAENMLAIVDVETEQVEKVEVGNGPAQVYIDGNNKFAYVANQGSEELPSNSVSVVDLAEKKVTATIETGKGAHGVVTSSDSKRLYVTNMFENTVTIIDTEQNKVIDTIEVGEVPNGISIMN